MPISGLVITIERGYRGDAAVEALKQLRELTLGERSGNQVPAALESADVSHSRGLHDQLSAIPGVTLVDVVYVNLESL